eukprot:15260_1
MDAPNNLNTMEIIDLKSQDTHWTHTHTHITSQTIPNKWILFNPPRITNDTKLCLFNIAYFTFQSGSYLSVNDVNKTWIYTASAAMKANTMPFIDHRNKLNPTDRRHKTDQNLGFARRMYQK